MGTHCSSELNRGHIFKSKTTTMKLLLLTVFVAGAFATEEAGKAEEPAAPVAVAPVHHGLRPFYGLWGHQQGWPGVVAPGFSSQCFGCRGKRSAEADAEAGYYGHPYYGYGHYYGLGYGYGHYGYPYHYGYRAFGPGVAGHAGGGTSFVARSPQGLGGKQNSNFWRSLNCCS